MRNGVLQTVAGMECLRRHSERTHAFILRHPAQPGGQKNESKVWSVYRLSLGSFQRVGYTVRPRSQVPRIKFFYNSDICEGTPPGVTCKTLLPEIHETFTFRFT